MFNSHTHTHTLFKGAEFCVARAWAQGTDTQDLDLESLCT